MNHDILASRIFIVLTTRENPVQPFSDTIPERIRSGKLLHLLEVQNAVAWPLHLLYVIKDLENGVGVDNISHDRRAHHHKDPLQRVLYVGFRQRRTRNR